MGKKTEKRALVPAGEKNLTPWQAELLADAEAACKQNAGIGGGLFASLKSGQLSIGGNPVPGNEIAVIVLGQAAVKTYYDRAYDPATPASPACYAIGETLEGLTPHKDSEDTQCENCSECPHNVFGSALLGKGKRCRDSVSLAMIEAGTLQAGVFHPFTDLEKIKVAEMIKMSIPPTSLKNWSNYVSGVRQIESLPPYACATRIRVVPDAKSQFKVEFLLAQTLPEEHARAMRARVSDATNLLQQPFPKNSDEEKSVPEVAKKPLRKGGRF